MRLSQIVASLAIALLPAAAMADAKIYATEGSIWCSKDGTKVKGIACDLAAEMAKRAGNPNSIDVMPAARAVQELADMTNGFFLPQVKGAPSAKPLQYVVKLASDAFVIVTSSKGTADASTPEAAKALSLGVLRGSPSEAIAKGMGMTKVDAANSQDINAKKLDAGRIDGWISTWNGARGAAKDAGIDPATLKRGAVLREIEFWVAASADVPAAEIEKWRTAFEAMRKDGTVEKIYKTYDYKP